MDQHTEHKGFAIAIYRPIHIGVTARMRGHVSQAVEQARDDLPANKLNIMAEFLTRKRDDFEPAMKYVRDKLKDKFDDRAADHSQEIETRYNTEVTKVAELNPQARDEATKAMQEIVSKVRANLSKARTETAALFE